MTGAGKKPFAAVRAPTAALKENSSPAARVTPSSFCAARAMFAARFALGPLLPFAAALALFFRPTLALFRSFGAVGAFGLFSLFLRGGCAFGAHGDVCHGEIFIDEPAVLFYLDAHEHLQHIVGNDGAPAFGRGDLRADPGHLFIRLAVILVFVAQTAHQSAANAADFNGIEG